MHPLGLHLTSLIFGNNCTLGDIIGVNILVPYFQVKLPEVWKQTPFLASRH